MKKIIIIAVILLAGAIVLFKVMSRPSPLDLGSKAEARGDYTEARAQYVQVVFDATESLPYPDKSKAITETEEQWKETVAQYLSWISYSGPMSDNRCGVALEGIKRCTSFVEDNNFITEKEPEELPLDSLRIEWYEAFARNEKGDEKEQESLIERAIQDTLSILQVRALNGYIYHAKLLDVRTGKRTDFILYPNSSIALLVKPRDYMLICSSEVQFTEGLKGKTWRSAEESIMIRPPDITSLKRITLKTRVAREK